MNRQSHFALFVLLLALTLASASVQAAAEPKWSQIHTAHFDVWTDAGDKRGREVALRMEQMRTLFGQLLMRNKLKMPLPITVIALKSDKYYGLVAPTKQNKQKAFYVPPSDHIYIVLNLFEADPWQAIAHPLAHYLMNYNYPPAQGWFDEGFAEYFGSLHVDSRGIDIGSEPELNSKWYENTCRHIAPKTHTPQTRAP